jgi:hypothetical protein
MQGCKELTSYTRQLYLHWFTLKAEWSVTTAQIFLGHHDNCQYHTNVWVPPEPGTRSMKWTLGPTGKWNFSARSDCLFTVWEKGSAKLINLSFSYPVLLPLKSSLLSSEVVSISNVVREAQPRDLRDIQTVVFWLGDIGQKVRNRVSLGTDWCCHQNSCFSIFWSIQRNERHH